MISTSEEDLICDLAETYGIYDYRALPVPLLATLAVGLREDSRIKMRMLGVKANKTDLLLAAIVDRLSILVWQNTENGHKGINPPKFVFDSLINAPEKVDTAQTFNTPNDFEAEWARITGVRRIGKQ